MMTQIHRNNLTVSLHQTLLNSQLEMEKMKVEQERKKAIFTQEAVKEKVLNFVTFFFDVTSQQLLGLVIVL